MLPQFTTLQSKAALAWRTCCCAGRLQGSNDVELVDVKALCGQDLQMGGFLKGFLGFLKFFWGFSKVADFSLEHLCMCAE